MHLTGDGGGKVPALTRPLRGRNRVANALIGWSRRAGRIPGMSIRPVEVNGVAGALHLDAGQRLIAVVALEIADGRITSISSVVNPDKLTHLGPVADFARCSGRRDERVDRVVRGHGGQTWATSSGGMRPA